MSRESGGLPNEDRSLKERVYTYWNKHVCGLGYGRSGPDSPMDFGAIRQARYQLEPYILELADFASGRGKRVLEIGVGAGVDFESWIVHGAQATGIDMTPAAVELTRQRLDATAVPRDSYTLRVGDAEHLDFEDGSFDIVYSYGALHHTPETEKAIAEVYRVLAPGGEFRGMVYHHPSVVGCMLWIRYCLLTGRVFHGPRWAVYRHLESPGTKCYTATEMRAMLAKCGFGDIEVKAKLSFGDLLLQPRSERYRSGIYALVWRLYPRWAIRLLGDGLGNALFMFARKRGILERGA